MPIRLAVLVAILLLAGCASAGDGKDTAVLLNSRFVGHQAKAFFLAYGMPLEKQRLPGDKTAYRWASIEPPAAPPPQSFTQIIHTPRGNAGVMEPPPQLPEPRFCEIRIGADRKGIIRHVAVTHDSEGNHSPSLCREIFFGA